VDGARSQIGAPILVDLDGRHLHQRFMCGGDLHAVETGTQVVLNYFSPDVPPGAGSCAMAEVSADLRAPLGRRRLIDGYTGKAVPCFALGNLLKPDSRLAVPDGQPTWTVPEGGWHAASFQTPYAAAWYRFRTSGARFLVIEALGDLVYNGGWQPQTPPTVDQRSAKPHSVLQRVLQSLQLRTSSRGPFGRSLEWNQDELTIALAVESTSSTPTPALVKVAQTFKPAVLPQ
jgi:hypothetical protein